MAISIPPLSTEFLSFYHLVSNSNVETTHRLRYRCKTRFRFQKIGQVEFDEGRGPAYDVVVNILDFEQ